MWASMPPRTKVRAPTSFSLPEKPDSPKQLKEIFSIRAFSPRRGANAESVGPNPFGYCSVATIGTPSNPAAARTRARFLRIESTPEICGASFS